ncbi:hypothetical protein GOODEAATRI_004310, partial [Goodea atripinnis]
VTELEEEMMKLQPDIVDVQRQPWRSGETLETLDESLVEESRTFESRLQSLLQETIQESESGMEVCKLLLKVMSLL